MQGRGEKRGGEHALHPKPPLSAHITRCSSLASSRIVFALSSFPLQTQTNPLTVHPDNTAVNTHRVLNSPLAVTLLLEVVSGSPEGKAQAL